MPGSCGTTWAQGPAPSVLVRVGLRCHPTCPGGTTQEASNARVPGRMYACARFAGLPGCRRGVGYWRGSIGMPVFSSVLITRRPA